MVAQQSRAKKGRPGTAANPCHSPLRETITRQRKMTRTSPSILFLPFCQLESWPSLASLRKTLTNVLFPGLMAEFHVDTSTVQWLTTGLSAYGSACHAALKLFQAQTEVAYHLPYCNRALHHRLPDGSLHVELSYADDRANTTGSGHWNRAFR